MQLRSRTPNGHRSITGKNNHLLLVVGVPRLFWGVSPLLLAPTGASAACCCRMWKMAVLEGRWSGSALRQSLMRTPMSSGHSSGTLHAWMQCNIKSMHGTADGHVRRAPVQNVHAFTVRSELL